MVEEALEVEVEEVGGVVVALEVEVEEGGVVDEVSFKKVHLIMS